jgi:hypothetical protein
MEIAGRDRGAGRAWRGGVGTTVALLLAGCATVTPQTLGDLAPGEAQRIDQTCEQTLGARPGGSYFEACRARLADAVRRQDAQRQIVRTRADCARTGSPPGSSEFALCVLGARSPDDPAVRPKPLALASRQDVHRRAERSCAKLGLDPDVADFADCVTELETAIAPPDDPTD